jgi:hypothetical protein
LTLAALAALGVSGCGLVLGLGDFEDSEDGVGAAGASSATTGSPGGSGPGTGGTGATGATGATGGTGGTGGGGQGGDGVGGMVEQCPVDTDCVAAPPAGWTGPAAFYLGGSPPASCPAEWPSPIAATAGNVSATLSCDACSCGAPTGVQCSVPSFTIWGNSSCSGAGTAISLPSNGTCLDTTGGYGAKVGLSVPNGGTCTAAGGTAQKGAVAWDNGALVCDDGAVAQCPTGVCAPKPEAPFDTRRCVYKDGEEPGCPLAYPNRTVVYRGNTDTRQCSNCSCGSVGGVTCPSVVVAWGNTDCSNFGVNIDYENGACNTSAYFAGEAFANKPVGGSCSVAGGAPSGGVAPALPLTVCCE